MAALRPGIDELVAELEPALASSWDELGVQLGLSLKIIDTVRREEQDTTNQLSRVLRVWMSDNPKGDWSEIVKALRAIDYHELAMDIQHKYIDNGKYASPC